METLLIIVAIMAVMLLVVFVIDRKVDKASRPAPPGSDLRDPRNHPREK